MEKDFKKINVLSYEDAIKDLIASGMTHEEAEEWLDKASKENDIAQQATYSSLFFQELSKREVDEIKPYFENINDISTFNLAKYLYYFNSNDISINIEFVKLLVDYSVDVNDSYILEDATLYNYYTGEGNPQQKITITPLSQSYNWKHMNMDLFKLLVNSGAKIENLDFTTFSEDAFYSFGILANILKSEDANVIEDLKYIIDLLPKNQKYIPIGYKISPNIFEILKQNNIPIEIYLDHFFESMQLDIESINVVEKLIQYSSKVHFDSKTSNGPIIPLLQLWDSLKEDEEKDETTKNELLVKLFNLVKFCKDNGFRLDNHSVEYNSIMSVLKYSTLKVLRTGWDTPLFLDFKKNYKRYTKKLISLLVELGADVNVKNNMGITPLIHYVYQNNLEMVQLLLPYYDEYSKYLSDKDDLFTFNLAMYLDETYDAKREPNLELIKYFINHNIGLQSKTDEDFGLIHVATYYSIYEIVKLLIEKSVDVNAVVTQKELALPPLVGAFMNDNYDYKIVKLLIDNGADVSIFNNKKLKNLAIDKACKNNDLELLNLLIKNGANRFSTNNLCDACENLNFEMIKILVDNEVEINRKEYLDPFEKMKYLHDKQPLSIVCSKAYYDYGEKNKKNKILNIVKFLLQHGADVNIDSPLMAACTSKYNKFIKINIFTEPINDAKYYKIYLEVIKLLIENGADVNYHKNDGASILMESILRANGYELAEILIENGADVNMLDYKRRSAIFYLGNIEMFIDQYGDECEEVENPDGSIVEIPVQQKVFESERILQLLIDNGADINHKNNMGMTPLMYYALQGKDRLVGILLENGANINAKSEMTALDLAGNNQIKEMISSKKNNHPQKLVKLLTNFTIDKPIKYTTHTWDFGELKKEYENFDGYMSAVKIQFESMKAELEELSPNLYKKVYTFLVEENPSSDYTWCSKTNINIGWSNLAGLKEHCNSGKNPFDFKLPKPFMIPPRRQISTFGEVINLFKQEIEIRTDFKNLETIFNEEKNRMNADFKFDLSTAKLLRQFYTDTQNFTFALNKIFDEIKKRKEYPNIEVTTLELDDRSIEIKITQIDSISSRSADELLQRSNQSGDLSDIVENLKNLCDYSIESSYENSNFRVNFLHSNNVKDIEIFEEKSSGFTHILRFYK